MNEKYIDDADLRIGRSYKIEIVSGMHDGTSCWATLRKNENGDLFFECHSPNDIEVGINFAYALNLSYKYRFTNSNQSSPNKCL